LTNARPAGRAFSLGDLDRVALDDRVREQLLAHFPDALLGFCLRQPVCELKLDRLAATYIADLGEAETAQRIANRLALRIQDAGLQADMDFRSNRSSLLTCRCLPAKRATFR